jgi:diguanylate cyclase (GGDEF)-like protein/PAS domain S-box-containing protein
MKDYPAKEPPAADGTGSDTRAEADHRLEAERSPDRFQIAMHSAAIGVCLVSPEGRFLDVNPALCEMLGRDAATLLRSTWSQLTHPDDLAVDKAFIQDVLANRIETFRRTKRYLRPDGDLVWGDLTVTCVRREDGAVSYFLAQITDITAQIAAEKELADTREALVRDKQRLQATLGSLLDPYVFMQAVRDRQGEIVDFTYLDANDAACAFLRRKRSQIVGCRVSDLVSEAAATSVVAFYAEAINTGTPLVLDEFSFSSAIQEEPRRFYDLRGVKLADGLSFTWRDVTDRYYATKAVAESEEHFRLLAENMSDVVIRMSIEGVIGWVSPSVRGIMGWEPEELVGQKARSFVYRDDISIFIAGRDAATAGRALITRCRLCSADGTYHWTEVHVSSHRDAHGVRDGFVLSFRTVDAEVEADRELERRARYDQLTGLLNRQEILDRVGRVTRATDGDRGCSAVLFCDIDNMKAINDGFGHSVGDEALRMVASRICGAIRRADVAGRIGGDEFLVVLDTVGEEQAAAIAQQICAAVEQPIPTSGGVVTIKVSIGVTPVETGESVDSVVDRADRAMYAVKHSNR